MRRRAYPVTRSGWCGCWRLASCASRSCPRVEDEQFRDLIRVIEDVRGDLMRARHRLAKFLLRRGERYRAGPGVDGKHMRGCARCASRTRARRRRFVDYLAAVELLVGPPHRR